MTRFALSPRAQADIDEIWEYSVKHWGVSHAETYMRIIAAAVEALAADPQRGRPCDDIRRGYRRHAVGSHIVFYRTPARHIEIVRVLHRRMDFRRHL